MGKTQHYNIIKLAIAHQLNLPVCPLHSLNLCHQNHPRVLLTHRDWKEPFPNSFSTKSSKNNTKPLHKFFLLWTSPDRKSSPPENRLDLMLMNSLHGLNALSVQEGNCCTAEEGSYRDGAATEGMALTKPVAPFLVSTIWSSVETHKLKQKFMLVRKKKSMMILVAQHMKVKPLFFPSLQIRCISLPPGDLHFPASTLPLESLLFQGTNFCYS